MVAPRNALSRDVAGSQTGQGHLPGGGDHSRTWPGRQGTNGQKKGLAHAPVRGPVAPQGNGLEGTRGEASFPTPWPYSPSQPGCVA